MRQPLLTRRYVYALPVVSLDPEVCGLLFVKRLEEVEALAEQLAERTTAPIYILHPMPMLPLVEC